MPFTYLAHQAPAIAIKTRWPHAVDGTALALGTMAPDWAYALSGSRLAFDAHTPWGIVAFCTPVAVAAALVLRKVSPVLFAYLPSPRMIPLGTLRVLGSGRPPLATSVVSALGGALTHVVWDLFTHNDRWGLRHIGWLRATAVTLFGHEASWAKLLQYGSHVGGSVIAVVLLVKLLRSGALWRWFGDGCRVGTDHPQRGVVAFVLLSAAGTLVGGVWAWAGDPGAAEIIRVSLGGAGGLASASLVCGRFFASPTEDKTPASKSPPELPRSD